MWIFDQLIPGKGNVNYCIRWDSKDTLAKPSADKIGTMLQRQLNEWNAWLMNYGCWPYENVTVAVVGWATNDTSLFNWNDDSLGTMYSNDSDNDGIPMCSTVFYKHRDGLNTNSDLASCEGAGYDLYLQLTEGMGLSGYG